VLSRLHHRYDKSGLPKDVELRAAGAIQGGIEIPKGAGGELPQGAKIGGDANKLQTRFVNLHPDISVLKCETPERYRWGKPPRTYRGARKIWVADQLASRDRSKIKPTELTLTAVPDLGIAGAAAKKEEAEAKAAADAKAAEEKCDCAVVGSSHGPASSRFAWLGFAALTATLLRRRRH
jgi:MYXO-CTERM domain-containing protein